MNLVASRSASRLRVRSSFAIAGFIATMATASLGCREPTRITVLLTTDVPCDQTRGSTMTIGAPGQIEDKAIAATSSACTPTGGRIGSIVVVPSNADNDEVGIKAVLGVGKNASDCKPPYGRGCIVARRALHFLPQTPLVVPIHLEAACDGVSCDPNTTCVHGQCLPDTIHDSAACESATGCDEGVLFPDAGAPDSTVADGPVTDGPNDAPRDGGTPDSAIDATITACGDMGGLAPGAPWPMTGYCPTRISRSPFVGPQTSNLKWSIPVSEIASVAIAADGSIYFVDNGALTAIGPDGGAKWSSSVSTMSGSTPTLGSDGNIYVGSAYVPTIYAFAADGGVVDTYPTGFDAGGVAVDFRASNGTLFLRLYDQPNNTGNVYVGVYDVGARRLVYKAPIGTVNAFELTVAPNGTIYASGYDAVLRAIAAGGSTAFTYDARLLTGAISPALFDGRHVAFGTYAGLFARDAFDGGPAWVAPLSTTGTGGVAVGADGTMYITTNDGQLVAVNPDNGGMRWSTALPSSPNAPCTPVIDGNGTIYVGTDIGVNAIRADGGVAWSYRTPTIVRDYLQIGDGVLIFHTDFSDGGMTLYAVGP